MSLSSSLLFGKKPTTPAKISLEDIRNSLEKVVAQQGSAATIDSSLYINHVRYLLSKVSCLKDYEKQERLEKEEAEYKLQEKTEKLKRRIADLEQQQQLSTKRQRVANVMKTTGSIGGVKVTDPDF
jgi:DNA-binding transcriptional MerR regulator